MPDFIIIGMQRCGTTSLYLNICQHLDVMGMTMNPNVTGNPNSGSEIHYFDYDRNYNRGINWYGRKRIKRGSEYVPIRRDGVMGEKSPTYLHCARAAKRASKLLPNAKLLVMLRNPVDRAYSHYRKACAAGYEALSTFEDALDAEPARLADQSPDGDWENSPQHLFAYVERGKYAQHLRKWFKYYSRDQFLVMQSEWAWKHPRKAARKVWRFLGVDDSAELKRADKRHQQIHYSPMATVTRAWLVEHFRPCNRKLEHLLEREFEGWDR